MRGARLAHLFVALIPLVWLPYLIKWRLGLHSDAAVPFLMARRMFAGEFPAYYWRQDYLGALDSYLVAGLMTVFGRDRVWLSDLPPLLSYAGFAALLVRMAPPRERTTRALLLLAAPPALFLAIVRPAFTQDAMLWLSWAALIAMAPGLDPDPRTRRAFARAAAAGLLLALFTWRIPTAMAGLVALGVLVLLTILRGGASGAGTGGRRAHAARLAQLAVVFAVAQLYHLPGLLSGTPPDMFTRMDVANLPDRLAALPRGLMQFDPRAAFGNTISGTYTFYSGLPPGVFREPYPSLLVRSAVGVIIVTAIMLLAAAGAVVTGRRALRAFRKRERLPLEPLYWSILLVMVIAGFLSHPSVWDMGGARYLAALFPPLVVLVSAVAGRTPSGRSWRAVKIGAAATWLALVAAGHVRMLALEDRFDADLASAIAYIREHGRDAGIADYSLAYVVDAMTVETLILDPGYNRRYRPYTDFFAARPAFALVEWRARIAEGNRIRVPPGEYAFDGSREFGEITVTLLRREGTTAGSASK